MKPYARTLEYLYALQGRGMKFGLRNIRVLLRSVDNPHRAFPSVHIAGTNGKGSTAAFLASVFTSAGYKTGLYTSPHLVRFTERIRIDGKEMPERRLVEYADALHPAIEEQQATFFEATTCIAFRYFADEGVDIAIVEVGLGGRLDSTNVVRPLVSVITNVSFDHMEYLGNTLSQIAAEKGGIIKRGIPCVTNASGKDVLATLRHIARTRDTAVREVRRIVSVKTASRKGDTVTFSMRKPGLSVSGVRPGLKGRHQIWNAATAFAALGVLMQDGGTAARFSGITAAAIRRGFEKVRQHTGLRARFETVNGRYILDVAHNVDGMKTLLASVSRAGIGKMICVFGVMKDKQVETMVQLLGKSCRAVICVRVPMERALSSSSLVNHFASIGVDVSDGGSVRNGISLAARMCRRDEKVLITGSHYVVGEALSVLERMRM